MQKRFTLLVALLVLSVNCLLSQNIKLITVDEYDKQKAA